MKREWVIECLEHNDNPGNARLFWRANSQGYTFDFSQAGLYTEHEACARCRPGVDVAYRKEDLSGSVMLISRRDFENPKRRIPE